MPPTADTVLVLTHSGDHFVTERVAAGVERRGARCVRLDSDLFPGEALLEARLGPGGDAHALRCGGLELHAGSVRAVWARRLWPARLPEDLDPRLRDGCLRESRAGLLGWLAALDGVRWVNPLGASTLAENKPRQLAAARAAGLPVPRTLVTNDPAAVRAFHAEAGPLVAKLLVPLSVSMGRAELAVRTSEVRPADLQDLGGLRLAPMAFQELLPKAREVRVACVGARCFAGAIDASRSQAGRTDWRGALPGEARWEPHDLPPAVAAALGRLRAALGLAFGAADLVVTPAGEHVFLELNPSGEWGMLERDLGLPIGDALAEELLRP